MGVTNAEIEIFMELNKDLFNPDNGLYISNNKYYEMINKLIAISTINNNLFKQMIEGFVLYRFSMDSFISYTYDIETDLLDITEATIQNFLTDLSDITINQEQVLNTFIKIYIGYNSIDDPVSVITDPNTSVTTSYAYYKNEFQSNKYSDTPTGAEYTNLYENVIKNNEFLLISPDIVSLSFLQSQNINHYVSYQEAKSAYLTLLSNLDTSDNIVSNLTKLKYRVIEFKNNYRTYPTMPNTAIKRILDKASISTLFLNNTSSDKYTNYNFLIYVLRQLYTGVSNSKLDSYMDDILTSNYITSETRALEIMDFTDTNIVIDTATCSVITEITDNETLQLTLSSVLDVAIGQTLSVLTNKGQIYGKVTNIVDPLVDISITSTDYEDMGIDFADVSVSGTPVVYLSYDSNLLFIDTLVYNTRLDYIPNISLGFGLSYDNINITTSTASNVNGTIIVDSEDIDKTKIYLDGHWYSQNEDIDLILDITSFAEYATSAAADVGIPGDKTNKLITIAGVTHLHNGVDWVDYSVIYSTINISETDSSRFDINAKMAQISILDKLIRRMYSGVSRVTNILPQPINGKTPHDNIILYFNDIYDELKSIYDYIVDPTNGYKIKDVS